MAKSIKPGLRINDDLWQAFKSKYPKKVNKMFTEWVKGNLYSGSYLIKSKDTHCVLYFIHDHEGFPSLTPQVDKALRLNLIECMDRINYLNGKYPNFHFFLTDANG